MNHPALTPPKPNLIKAILAGFETVSNHLGLVLFSIMLDLFIWFGPRVSIFNLIKGLFFRITDLPEMQTPEMTATITLAREFWMSFAESINLFGFLRTFPVGIPSLMILKSPANTPIFSPVTWEAPTSAIAFLIVISVVLFGIFLGTIYFFTVSQAAVEGKITIRRIIKDLVWASFQVLFLSLIGLVLLFVTMIPLSCILSVFVFSGIGMDVIAMVFIFIFLAIMMWWLLPIFFAPHGIFIHRYNTITSIKSGVRMTRFTLPTTALLVIVVILLSEGLNLLWLLPPGNSWFALIGVLGHAFIASSLLAATFIYYRDAELWVDDILERAKQMSVENN